MDTDKLRRLVIGDALESPSGYRVDYLQPADTYGFAYAVTYQNQILMMTCESEKVDRYLVCQFIEHTNKHLWIDLPPAGSQWRTVEAGSEHNPLWDHPIKVIRTPDAEWFSSPSPHTNKVRRYLTVPRRANHRCKRRNGHIYTIDVTPPQFEGSSSVRSSYTTGFIYTFQERSYYLREHAPLSRLASIREATVGSLTEEYLRGEGLVAWQQYRARWKRAGNRAYSKDAPIWVLDFVPVHRIAPITRPALLEQPQVPIIQQLPLLMAEASA